MRCNGATYSSDSEKSDVFAICFTSTLSNTIFYNTFYPCESLETTIDVPFLISKQSSRWCSELRFDKLC